MVRWKLLGRSKSKEDTTGQIGTVRVETKTLTQPMKTVQTMNNEPEEVPAKEYNEILYARSAPLKKQATPIQPKKEPVQRTSWENPNTIERNVDVIGVKKAGTVTSSSQTSDEIEKKVDRILAKKKLEP
jgi:hypothetical protein